MKKLVLLILPAAILFVNAQAQTAAKKGCDWGLKLGMNVSNLRMDESSSDWKGGLVTGAYFKFKLGDMFSLQPELLYSSMGGKMTVNGGEGSVRLNYFSVPVLLQHKLSKSFAVYLGPQIDVMIQAKTKTGSGFDKVTDSYKENSFNATGGIAVWPVKCLGVYARYIYGLNDISVGMDKVKNQGVQLTAALKLGKNRG